MLIAVMMAVNYWRAYSDPVGFAAYFGAAGAADANPAFVIVYSSRALFLTVVTAVLIATYQVRALKYFALVAVIMPVLDAVQVAQAGGPSAIVARHITIAAYLVATGHFLHRKDRANA